MPVGVSLHGLSKLYGDRVAIQNLNISFYEGHVTTLLGPNGAGKTTTMYVNHKCLPFCLNQHVFRYIVCPYIYYRHCLLNLIWCLFNHLSSFLLTGKLFCSAWHWKHSEVEINLMGPPQLEFKISIFNVTASADVICCKIVTTNAAQNEPVHFGKSWKKIANICCPQVSPDRPFCTICGLHWSLWQRHADQHRRGSQRAWNLHAVRCPLRTHDHQGAPAAVWPDQGTTLDTERAPRTSPQVSNRMQCKRK